MKIAITRTRPVAMDGLLERHATLVLALSASLSMLIWVFLIVRLAYLPDLFNIPHVQMHWLDRDTGAARTQLIIAFTALAVLYYMGWRAAHYAERWIDWAIVTVSAVSFGFALLLMYPFGAADLFDNVMHARIFTVYHANPFKDIINQFPNDPFVPYTAWRYSPSAYGPLWELAAGGAALLAGDHIILNIINLKLLPGVFWMLSLLVAGIFLLRSGRRPALPAFLLLAWNPMVLYEAWGNGHNDMMMAFFILLAAWLIYEKRFTLAVVALVAGTLVKYMPILLVPAAGLIALRALPDNRHRLIFILSTAALSAALIVISFQPFWYGIDTLTIGRRAEMLSGGPASAIYTVLTTTYHLDKDTTAKTTSLILVILTDAFALWQGFLAMRKPTAQSFINRSFYILMFYLLVTVPWYQHWYAIWPLVLVPFLEPLARNLAVVFSFGVLGKQLWVDPMLFWGSSWSPLPDREIAFAIGNLIWGWLYAIYVLGTAWKDWLFRPHRMRIPANLRTRVGGWLRGPEWSGVPVTGEQQREPGCD